MKELVLAIVVLATTNCFAQNSDPRQFIFLDDWSYDLMDYWINGGSLTHPFVLNQPYTTTDFKRGMTIQNEWTRLLGRYYNSFYGQPGSGKIILYGRENASVVSDGSLPPRRGLQSAPAGDVLLFDNRSKNHYNVAAQVNLLFPHISFVNRTMMNSEYLDDPLYPGDTGEWIFGRINDAYLNINTGGFDLFLGRIDRNWGALSSFGLILSNNPYSYDHLQVSYSTRRFKFSMIATRLEDLQAATSQTPDSLFESRKFMTAHRFDFSISDRLQFALTEVAMYGGPDRDFEPGYLNPMNYFYLVQRNNGAEISSLLAFDIFYKLKRNVNFFLQFLVDDFVVNNEPGRDDRGQFPDRLGITLKISEADLLAKGLQTTVEYTRIGNRTYQSKKSYENFHYRDKSLGFPTSSIEQVSLGLNYFDLFPAIFKFKASFQRAGNVRLTDVFLLQKEPFPVPFGENKWEIDLSARYFANHWSHLSASLCYENLDNYNNSPGDDRRNLKFILGVHLNLAAKFNFD